jgi:hypothetical protein
VPSRGCVAFQMPHMSDVPLSFRPLLKCAHMRFASSHDFDEKLKRVQMAGNEMHQIRK